MEKRAPKKRRNKREIKKELRSIYEDADGKMPDLSKLAPRTSGFTRTLITVVVFLSVIAILAWAGFFLFTQGLFQDNESLTLNIEGPETAISGEEVSYTIRYENTGNVPVASLSAKLNFPSTFHIYSTIPETTANEDEWTIGSLSPGSDGAITINGIFLSEVPSSQRIQALFNYKPANFSSEFQDLISKKVTIDESVVALSLSGPEKALAGDESEYILNVQNMSTDPIYNLRVTPALPDDFTVTAADPEMEEGTSYWNVDILEPGELLALTLNGAYTSSAAGEQTLSATIGFVDEDLVLTQATQDLLTDVLGGSVGFSLIVNGSNNDQTAEVGQILRLSIDYENNSDQSIEDLSFELSITGEGDLPIDWENASISDGLRTSSTIVYNSETHEELTELNPSDEGVIDISLPIYDTLTENATDTFTINLKAVLSQVAGISSVREIESTPIVVSLNSDTSIAAHARYFSTGGTSIGTGPLPPIVGETSTFRVYWSINNALHALDDIEFMTTLPQDVTWLDNADKDIGDVTYDATTRQVTWTTSRLPTEVESAGAWFEIAINPAEQDIGSFMKLTNTTSFTATDSETSTELSDTLDLITTELPNDDFASGLGVVMEE
jgi:uncharacterized repeat protein (TIGR01451 family)